MNETILFMRRRSSIISQKEQIRQAIRSEFGELALFDDNGSDSQITTTDGQQFFANESMRLFANKDTDSRFLSLIQSNIFSLI